MKFQTPTERKYGNEELEANMSGPHKTKVSETYRIQVDHIAAKTPIITFSTENKIVAQNLTVALKTILKEDLIVMIDPIIRPQ